MKIERNALCPCGSGKKHKKCHGAAGMAGAGAPAGAATATIANPQQLFEQALSHHRAGEFEPARLAYQHLLQAYPDHADVLHNLGLVQIQLGEARSGIALIQRAIKLSPGSKAFYANLAAALVAEGEHAQALDAFGHAGELLAAGDPQILGNYAIALQGVGRIAEGMTACEAALKIQPSLVDVLNTLANLSTDARRYEAADQTYRRALQLRADSPKVRSNHLMLLNYWSQPTAAMLLAAHRDYGAVHARLWEALPPQFADRLDGPRRLRLAYLSGDFGQHPVGNFLSGVLGHHDRSAFELTLYSTRTHHDALAQGFRQQADHWCDCQGLSDAALFLQIRRDEIDILVDLAGHTAGNRLPVLAMRPAPIQMTYLGHATTSGVQAIDYRLTDATIDPPGSDAGSEEAIRLQGGMFRYAPPMDAPAVAPVPLLARGAPTLGCFCNLSKVTPDTVALWSRVLGALPSARLVLKAKSLADEGVRRELLAEFAGQGVAAERIDLRPWSGHLQHLADYAQIDVMLDTVPFNLAANTCEALWMGVPVVSLAAARPAGRMGASLLGAAGLAQWSASSADDFVSIVQGLVRDPAALVERRAGLREQLRQSALLDGRGLASQLDAAYRDAWQRWVDAAPGRSAATATPRSVLHVGCGSPEAGQLPAYFRTPDWRELRLDIDPAVAPDYVASTTDMRVVPDGKAQALYSSHNVEHLQRDQVAKALAEFRRVLSDDGFALIVVPDLKLAAECVLRDEQEATLYDSPAGPISALDMIYGYGPFIQAGNAFMQHKTGFTARSLESALRGAGFARTLVQSQAFSLWALAFKH